MATQNITEFINNNRKRQSSVACGTLPYSMPRGVTAVSGDTYVVAVIPPKSIITNAYLVVTEAYDSATSATVVGKIGATTVFNGTDVTTVATTTGSVTAVYTGETSVEVTVTPTLTGSTTTGAVKLFVEYIEEAATLMYAEAQ